MSTPEQLNATTIRLAVETAPGSGTPAAIPGGEIYAPPMTAAAAQREIRTMVTRRGPHRTENERAVVAQSWTLATSHEIGLPTLRWLLQSHLTARGAGRYTLDPEAPCPTYVIETESEAGDLTRYLGAAVTEIRIAIDERKVVRLDLQWAALARVIPDDPLTGTAGPSLAGAMVPTRACGFAATTGPWGADPRIDDAVTIHGGQVFLTRSIAPANFTPDGIPTIYDRAPWEVTGEVYLPETPGLTDVATDTMWAGKVALWIGAGADSLRIDRASGTVADEDLLAFDWRTRRLTFQGMVDDRRSILDFLT